MMKPNRIRSFWRNTHGAAGLEAAIILPIFIFFIVGVVELYQQYRAQGIIDQAAASIAHSVSQQSVIYDRAPCTVASNVCVYDTLAAHIFAPLDYAENGKVSVAVLVAVSNGPSNTYRWSSPDESTGATPLNTTGWKRTYPSTSDVAMPTTLPGLPEPQAGDAIIVVDTAYRSIPFVLSAGFWRLLTGERTQHSRSVAIPLYADLRQLRE